MRVLYLAPPARQPGAKLARYSFLHEEIHALAAAGVDVFVLSPYSAPSHTQRVHVRTSGGRIAPSEIGDVLAMLIRQRAQVSPLSLIRAVTLLQATRTECLAARVIQSDRIDVVHSHFGWPKGFGGLLASRKAAVPLVASFHGADILVDRSIEYGRGRDAFFGRTIRRLLSAADRTIYYSEYMRDLGIRMGASRATSAVVRWGIDIESFGREGTRMDFRKELGLPERPTLLAVAGLIRRKGIDFVVRALRPLRDRLDFTLVVCGDGPEMGNLTRLAAELGLQDRVMFAGRVERSLVPKYFRAADVFVHGALYEAAGIVLIEAMASECPVVCTDAGGPAEYVQHGVTGFVVPVGDVECMSSYIARLVEDPEMRDGFGQAGRERAVAKFRREQMTEALIKEYAAAIGNSTTREIGSSRGGPRSDEFAAGKQSRRTS